MKCNPEKGCEIWESELKAWRVKGGRMPKRRCFVDHRPACKACGELTEARKSGLCNKCYRKSEREKLQAKGFFRVGG